MLRDNTCQKSNQFSKTVSMPGIPPSNIERKKTTNFIYKTFFHRSIACLPNNHIVLYVDKNAIKFLWIIMLMDSSTGELIQAYSYIT